MKNPITLKKKPSFLYRYIFMVFVIIVSGFITGAISGTYEVAFTPKYIVATLIGAAAGVGVWYLVDRIMHNFVKNSARA